MKTCTICQHELSETEFNKRKVSKDGLQNVCRSCNSKRSRQYYSDNREKHLKAVKEKKSLYVERAARIVEVFKWDGCALCDEDCPCCMDFHHYDPKEKDFELGKAGNDKSAVQTILNEIAKCVCICSNCHRKVHKGLKHVSEQHKCCISFEKLLKMYDQGVITDHELTWRLNEHVENLDALPEPWKSKVQKYREETKGKKLRTFSIVA